MTTFSSQLDAALRDLAWSQWTELGVRGVIRRHERWSIDPEALLVLTAALGPADPRLRDESLDWCVTFQRHLSRSRMKTIARRTGVVGVDDYERFVATVAQFGQRKWPEASADLRFEPSGKAERPDLRQPALIRLRLRAMFGVSARAELMHALIARPTSWRPVIELASLAAYTKRNVVDELDGLEAAGLLEASTSGNRHMYRLASPGVATQFVGPVPEHAPDWITTVTVLIALHRAGRAFEDLRPRVRDVEASAQIEALQKVIAGTDFVAPPPVGEGWHGLTRWGLELAETVADGIRP